MRQPCERTQVFSLPDIAAWWVRPSSARIIANRLDALFASLGREERDRKPSIDPAAKVLMDASAGKISIMEAARRLELPDAGYVFHRLAGASLPLPRLSAADVNHQLAMAKSALDACLVEPIPVGKKSG